MMDEMRSVSAQENLYSLKPAELFVVDDSIASSMDLIKAGGENLDEAIEVLNEIPGFKQAIALLKTTGILDSENIIELFRKVTPTQIYEPSQYIFPLCQYERDIPDDKLSSFIDSDENFNQDLKCYIDKLTETDEFQTLFNYIINAKKYPSSIMLYSAENFYSSLGIGPNERDEPNEDEEIPPQTLDKIFNDSRAEARKLFVANYKRKDFDPPDEEDEYTEVDGAVRRMLAETTNYIAGMDKIPFWIQARRKTDSPPTDAEGNPCANQYGGFLSIKKSED